MSYSYVRTRAARNQTPQGIVQDVPTAYEQQISPVIAALKADGEYTQPVRELLEGGSQAHHIVGLRAVDPLFQNNTPEQNAILQRQLGGGNQIANLINLPQRAHQGVDDELGILAVHNIQRDLGLEQNAAASKLHPVLQEINMAADMPFEYKQHLADQYLDEVDPLARNAINDSLQDYDQRFVRDKIDNIIQSQRGSTAGRDVNNTGAASGDTEKMVINNTGSGTVNISHGIEDQVNNSKKKTRMAGDRIRSLSNR